MKGFDAEVLDLLVDGPNSFASIYYGVHSVQKHTVIEVADILSVLLEFVGCGFVQVVQDLERGVSRVPSVEDVEKAEKEYNEWLFSSIGMSETSCDEVGLWFNITKTGRAAWAEWFGVRPEDQAHWSLNDRVCQRILEVRADRSELADRVLDNWLAEHGNIQVISGTRAMKKAVPIVFSDGTEVLDGVLLTCRYRLKKK